jgi:hypothetical protein
MKRALLAVLCGLVCAASAYADVRTEEKSQVKFEGMLGRVAGIFGGRGVREGVTTIVVVKGDRKSTTNGETQQIVDLKEEKIYDIDLKDKTYRVVTFAQLREQMEEARRKAAEQQAKETPKAGGEPQQQPQFEMDYSLKETGQRKAINGFDTHEVVMTITMREKGKTLEQSGGIVLTNSMWLAPLNAAQREIMEFDIRYAEKLASALFDARQMAAMTAMYPQMQQAMAKMQAENVKLDGTTVLSEMKFETVASAEQIAEASKADKPADKGASAPPTSITGLGGLIGRRIAAGNKDKDAAAAAPPPTPGHAILMTMHHELLKVTPEAADADVSVPAGFKLKS